MHNVAHSTSFVTPRPAESPTNGMTRSPKDIPTPVVPPPTHVELPPVQDVATTEPEMFPFNFHAESGKPPCLELVRTLVILLPSLAIGDGSERITEVHLRIPRGTRINYHSPRWRWRRDLILAHFELHPDQRLRSRAHEWAARVLIVDK